MAQTDKQMQDRTKKRLKRKKALALGQVEQFEDTLSAHELNIARLRAIPEADRPDDFDVAVENEEKAISTLTSAIATSLTEAEKITDTDTK